MKKLLTILFSVGMMSTAFAQSHEENDRVQNGKYNTPSSSNKKFEIVVSVNSQNKKADKYETRRDDSYAYNTMERDVQLQRINREFEARIIAVNNNRRLRAPEKSRQVSIIETERREKIREINSRYSRSDDRYDNHYATSDRKRW